MQALVHPSVVSYSHDYPYNHMYVITLYIQLHNDCFALVWIINFKKTLWYPLVKFSMNPTQEIF